MQPGRKRSFPGPAIGYGVHIEEKCCLGLGLDRRIVATISQPSFDTLCDISSFSVWGPGQTCFSLCRLRRVVVAGSTVGPLRVASLVCVCGGGGFCLLGLLPVLQGSSTIGFLLGPWTVTRSSHGKLPLVGHCPLGHEAMCALPCLRAFPHPSPPTLTKKKTGTQVRGGGGAEGSKSKKLLGDNFASQNDDFTGGQTSDVINWGMLHGRPPLKRRAVWRPHLHLLSQSFFDAISPFPEQRNSPTRFCLANPPPPPCTSNGP